MAKLRIRNKISPFFLTIQTNVKVNGWTIGKIKSKELYISYFEIPVNSHLQVENVLFGASRNYLIAQSTDADCCNFELKISNFGKLYAICIYVLIMSFVFLSIGHTLFDSLIPNSFAFESIFHGICVVSFIVFVFGSTLMRRKHFNLENVD